MSGNIRRKSKVFHSVRSVELVTYIITLLLRISHNNHWKSAKKSNCFWLIEDYHSPIFARWHKCLLFAKALTFDKHMFAESTYCVISAGGTPRATAAFITLAPSRWTFILCSDANSRTWK